MACQVCDKETIFGLRSKQSIIDCTCKISECKILEEFLVWCGEFDCFKDYRPTEPNKKEILEMVRLVPFIKRRNLSSEEYDSISWFICKVMKGLEIELDDELSYLDVGGGSGQVAMSVGKELCTVPVITDLIKRIEKDFDFDLIKADYTLPYLDSTFRLVTVLSFLHHLQDPVKLVKEIHRVLEEGGYCIIQEFDCKSWERVFAYDTFHELVHETCDSPCPKVTEYRSREGWRTIFKENGFTTVDSYCLPHNPIYQVYIDTFRKCKSKGRSKLLE